MKVNKIYIIIILVMLSWGINVSALKVIVANFMPITITSLRIFVASLTAFLILTFLRLVRLPKKSEIIYIIGGAFLSVFFHHFFLAEGLTKTSATNTGLILGLGPLLTVVFSMIFLRRKPSWIQFTGFILGTLGVSTTVLVGSGGVNGINLGDVHILLSITSQALSFILIKRASETMEPRLLTVYMLLIGSFFLFIVSLWKEPGGIDSLIGVAPSVWAVFLFSAIIATGVGHMAYNYAIGQVGPAESSIFLNLNTFFSLIGAALFLGESIVPGHFIGLILIVSGVLLGSGGLEAWLLKRKQMRSSGNPSA
ncbi:DMT family transporter [Virgibacillus alimentarius]|uniref:Drug/metabolite transporter (DMT)-like permease n=1 Tax=Virgibacillus alimentarius TaxID=698769 RepID=A0ABS4S8F4_9BACI|nr:DMT family transporter [Virgibacillus alimentarius]MBP2257773.1 drug/metabolite transporter (DMT)-like permease [Virgibacillus alimentarius]